MQLYGDVDDFQILGRREIVFKDAVAKYIKNVSKLLRFHLAAFNRSL